MSLTKNLAINGGPKVQEKNFPNQSTIGAGEIEAAYQVLKSGVLTGYKGNAGDGFYGGPEIRSLEKEWEEMFSDKGDKLHCIPINSCTSGLFVACGAIGLEPRDEVIVTPYSMTCSATVPLIWGAKPVFADIHPETFNLDPKDVRRKITSKTKAIIVVDLFGLPYDEEIDKIAVENNLMVIEDAAQAVGASRKTAPAGTLGHIGVFSFNQGKHLTCGEGGMICTYDENLATKCRLLMNHGEAVINDHLESNHSIEVEEALSCYIDYSEVFGFNLRLTEINAAILRVQLKRALSFRTKRVENVKALLHLLKDIPGLTYPKPPDGYIHSFYVLPLLFDENVWGAHRDKVVEAVKAELMPCEGRTDEGVTINSGYIKPIWRMPVFDAYFTDLEMATSIAPVCDEMWKNKLIIMHRFFGSNAKPGDMEDVANAFKKVWNNREELKC